MNCDEARPLLNAYLDEELDLQGWAAVERHVAGCSACTREYAALEELRREIADADLGFSPSPEFKKKIAALGGRERASWRNRSWGWTPMLVAAAALCIVLIAVPGRLGWGSGEMDREIVDNHIRSLVGTHLVDVPSSDRHTVKPWFQGKTSFSPIVPDLEANGFTLIGGRLDVVRQERVAALIYKRREHVINLFVAPMGGGNAATTTRESSGYHVLAWSQGGMRYWAVSDLGSAELREFVELVQPRLQ